jgi:hypothetical protein
MTALLPVRDLQTGPEKPGRCFVSGTMVSLTLSDEERDLIQEILEEPHRTLRMEISHTSLLGAVEAAGHCPVCPGLRPGSTQDATTIL